MDRKEKLAVIEEILDWAGDKLGDITPRVRERFFAVHPDGKALFIRHGGRDPSRLEGDMIESALFCLLNWFERPGEVESIFRDTVPHHEILEIDAKHFSGLLRAVFDVIGDVMPACRPDWYRVWGEARTELLDLAEGSSLSALIAAR